MSHEALKNFVTTKLCCNFWTPEQISGWLKHRQSDLPSLCHESIYAWIYSQKMTGEKLWKFLPRHKRKRGMRKSNGAGINRIPNRVSIHDRPKEAANRDNFGHWESDLMSFLKNSQHLLVAREKKSMFIISTRLTRKTALETSTALVDSMKTLPPEVLQTMTFDNGGEFAGHEKLFLELGIPCFFCDPYSPWQKGGVENTNGRLRRDLSRNTNLHNMSEEEFDENILNYNTTPRKSLGWLTPLEAFNRNLQIVALRS
jgi:IS30 family transposase